MGVVATTLLKEEQMGVCHSHNVLCGCIFVGNTTYGVQYVALRETSKGRVDKERGVLLVQLIQRVIKMFPKKEHRRTMNIIEVTEKEEALTSEVYAEHC